MSSVALVYSGSSSVFFRPASPKVNGVEREANPAGLRGLGAPDPLKISWARAAAPAELAAAGAEVGERS